MCIRDSPHTCKELPLNYFDERDYQFVSGYRKEFALPRGMKMKGNRFLLHFEGVANAAKVYLNGTLLGEHKGGYTAFVFDVTDTVKSRGNVLAVEVDSTERPEIPPFGRVVDYLCYGGIYREVWLECVNEVYIDCLLYTSSCLWRWQSISKSLSSSQSLSRRSPARFRKGAGLAILERYFYDMER